MTDASFTGVPRFHRAATAQNKDMPLPKPQPFGAPVFVNDCVSPLAGETVLSLLMKRLTKDDDL